MGGFNNAAKIVWITSPRPGQCKYIDVIGVRPTQGIHSNYDCVLVTSMVYILSRRPWVVTRLSLLLRTKIR